MYSSDSQYPSDSSDSNFELRGKRKSNSSKNGNFEKNYPKNILTSIIAALEHKNYQKILIDKGISGREIQRKNSASISLIHEILTHQLINPFNKHQFELLTSNILLQNSKISKKAFHLLQIREAFSFSSSISLSQFRLEMSLRAKTNSLKSCQNLDFFQYQSSTMYLLTLFCKVLEDYPNLNNQMLENRESTFEQIKIFEKSIHTQEYYGKKTRDVLKPSIRQLSLKLNSSFWDQVKYANIYQFIRDNISNTEQKIIQNLGLKHGMPYLRSFCPEVVLRCFDKLQRGEKITISKLDLWVKEYQTKSLDCVFESGVLDSSPSEQSFKSKTKEKLSNKFSKKIKKQRRPNKFFPIVLTAPIRNTHQTS